MAIESHSALTPIADNNLENRSISELVSILRTSFRTKDFDQVEEVLVAKELKMRKEIENKSKEYELLQSKFEFLRLDNLTRESLLEPKGYAKWKERESEIKILKELIVKVDEDREKKKSAMERLEKLLESAKKTLEDDRMIIEKLNHKNLELERAMEEVKKTMEDHEKTIEELRCKNFELECSVKELRCRKSELELTIEVVKKTEEDDWKCIEELKCKNSKLECAKREAEHNYELCRRKYDELVRRVSQLENRNDSISGGSGFGGSRKLVGKRGAENDKIENQSDSDGDIQNRYDLSRLKSKDPEKRYNEKWEAEAEMRAAFDENDLLCMEAVCILYKQSSSIGKPSSGLPSRQRGFNEADMLRGSTLALFLTSGDSKGTLKKSVMELKNFDIGGLIDCRRIAIKYLKQLFEIYKKNEDQFLFQ